MTKKLKFIATIFAVVLTFGGVLQTSVQTSAAAVPSVNIPAAGGSASTPVSAVQRITGMQATQAIYENSIQPLEVLAVSSPPPCGLDYREASAPFGPLKVVYYTIRNCSNSTVRRRLNISGTTDGTCHTISPHKYGSYTRIIAGWALVNGLKSC